MAMEWLAKKIITGCEADGTLGVPYLIRWKLAGAFGFGLLLHKFVRSDGRDYHDHPWPYVSLMLWGRYVEYSPKDLCQIAPSNLERGQDYMWFRGPGSIKYYPAKHLHRLELHKRWTTETRTDGLYRRITTESPAWTLVFHWPVQREWGFVDAALNRWRMWTKYFADKGC